MHAAPQRDLKKMFERICTQKSTYYIIPFMQNLRTNKTNHGRNQNRKMFLGGEGQDSMEREMKHLSAVISTFYIFMGVFPTVCVFTTHKLYLIKKNLTS